MGTQKKRLNETIRLSTHIIGFGWAIRQILRAKEIYIPPYQDPGPLSWIKRILAIIARERLLVLISRLLLLSSCDFEVETRKKKTFKMFALC